VQLADAGGRHNVSRAASKLHRWGALGVITNFDVAPADAAAPAGAERFEHGFLRGPAAGVVLRGRFAGAAVFDLVVGVDARDEQLAVLLDHLRDSQAFHDVDAGADDGHEKRSDVGGRGLGNGVFSVGG
jgi:hypothetical protein